MGDVDDAPALVSELGDPLKEGVDLVFVQRTRGLVEDDDTGIPGQGPGDLQHLLAGDRQLLYQLVGGLRSGMGYTGSKDIATLRTRRDRFVRATSQGLRESHVHDVIITKEAPNYRLEP